MLRALRTQWFMIALGLLLGALAGLGLAKTRDQVYTGTAQIFVAALPSGSSGSDLAQGNTFTQGQVNTYARLVNTPVVLEPARTKLKLAMSVGDLSGQVSAAAPANTSLVSVTARAASAQAAATITNAVAESLVQVIPTLEQNTQDQTPAVRATVVEPAQPPQSPASPNVPLFVLAGLLLGTAVGVGTALLRERTDSLIRDKRDLAKITDVPVLGSIPFEPGVDHSPEVVRSRPGSAVAESFRHLRTTVLSATADQQARTVLVTSTLAGEGKSFVALNLAAAAGQTSTRVLLLDADLRGARTQVDMELGLSDVLLGEAALDQTVRSWNGQDHLDVVSAGGPVANPSELLSSPAMEVLLNEVSRAYDFVVIDAPALLPVTDAAALARLTDSTVVVVASGSVEEALLTEAFTILDAVGARPLGCVVTMAPRQRRRVSSPTSARGGGLPPTTRSSRSAGAVALSVRSAHQRSGTASP